MKFLLFTKCSEKPELRPLWKIKAHVSDGCEDERNI